MSQQESVGPSMGGAGEPKRQVVDLEMLVVATRSLMEIGRPCRDASVNIKNTAFPIGSVGEPLEMSPRERPAELQRAGISLVVRLWGAVVELRAQVEEDSYVVWWTRVQLATTSAIGSSPHSISWWCLKTSTRI